MKTEQTQDLIEQVQAELVAARRRLGEAVAAGDPGDEIRAEADALAERLGDLRAALPVLRERDEAEVQAREQEARAAHERAQDERREAHLTACRRVDEALSALGKAYRGLMETDANVGGEPSHTGRSRRNRGHSLRAAFMARCPELTRELRLERVRSIHVAGLEESEAKVIGRFGQ